MRRLAAVLLITLASDVGAQVVEPVGSLAGTVVSTDGSLLPYSIVSVASRGVEQLATDRATFRLTRLPAGEYDLLVRHLGYSPKTTHVAIRAGATDTIRVTLAKLAVQLAAVDVNAKRQCTDPGPPSAKTSPSFAAVFQQLEQNADQYRVLATTYPFTYDMERRETVRYIGGDSVVQRLDTIRVATGMKWHYAPGTVVERTDDPRNRQVVINIPALIHFADPAFLANHCFFFGGREMADGRSTLRIDFLAATRLEAPDVDGSIYLDPSTYQIVWSMLHLTRIPAETPEISDVVVTTEFRAIVPSISIASLISSVHRLSTDSTRPTLPAAAYETQRLVHVTFLNGRP